MVVMMALLAAAGCSFSGTTGKRLDSAEALMESSPDSALMILDSISASDLHGRREKARYALLKSIALDKNYVDTATFDVLQPAIDFYLDNGSPDEKLKTYYYQGRIYQNAGNEDLAMQAWLSGNEVKGNITDSLTLARLLVAQGILYHKQYRIEDFVERNLRAGDIYVALDRPHQAIKGYCNALNGEVILLDKSKSDSIIDICRSLSAKYPETGDYLSRHLIDYTLEFGSEEDIRNFVDKFDGDKVSDIMRLKLAKGYSKIGDTPKTLEYLEDIKLPSGNVRDSLIYWYVRSLALENIGDYRSSLESMREYIFLFSRSDYELLSNELLFSYKKHELEVKTLMESQKRRNMIWISLSVVLLLLAVIMFIWLRNRLNVTKRAVAEQEAEKLRLNNELLMKEKQNAELEVDNLRLELVNLEEERDRLTGLLKERPDMTPEMMKVIYERLDMLNSLLAKEISSNDSYARPLIESIRKDRAGFLKSTRVALGVSHPGFMRYLEEHSLTDEEIHYVCLYAIGLRGKDIGEYIQMKRHYVMGSGIRKKLGIDEHETNLGPYIRKLMKEYGAEVS